MGDDTQGDCEYSYMGLHLVSYVDSAIITRTSRCIICRSLRWLDEASVEAFASGALIGRSSISWMATIGTILRLTQREGSWIFSRTDSIPASSTRARLSATIATLVDFGGTRWSRDQCPMDEY
jgi:hypothetical protein